MRVKAKKEVYFTIIIPLKKRGNQFIEETVKAICNQNFDNFELIIIEDKPNGIKSFTDQRIRVFYDIHNAAAKRNMASLHAMGKVLTFLDSDAYPPPGWLEKTAAILGPNPNQVLGGPGIEIPDPSFWEKMFNVIITSFFGSGTMTYRFTKQKKRMVDDLPAMNLFIPKQIFTESGGFPKEYWPGEDSKLCLAIRNLGYEIRYDPSLWVYHHRRKNPLSFLKQHAFYGYHRGMFFLTDGNSRKFIYLLPICIVMAIVLASLSALHIVFIMPLLIYSSWVTGFFFFTLMDQHRLDIAFMGAILLVCMHVVYGLAFIVGLVKVVLKIT